MIDLPDLEGLDIEQIKSLLTGEKSSTIEIYLPKTTQQYFNEAVDIAYDYAFAAYSAQELSRVSGILKYHFAEPAEFESYMFTINFSDPDILAETLYQISCLYGFNETSKDDNDEENEIGEPNIEDVDQFLYEVESGQVIAVCPDIVQVYIQFIPAEEHDDE
jgi:hypothetical protein